MHNFKELKVFQKARILVKNVYRLLHKFPHEEHFGLTSQIRRAAISVMANIAEGSGRNTDKDFARFLSISLGSAYELEAELIVAYDLGYLTKENLSKVGELLKEVQKMTYTLILKYSK